MAQKPMCAWRLSQELLDRLRKVAHATGMSQAQIVEAGIIRVLEVLESQTHRLAKERKREKET